MRRMLAKLAVSAAAFRVGLAVGHRVDRDATPFSEEIRDALRRDGALPAALGLGTLGLAVLRQRSAVALFAAGAVAGGVTGYLRRRRADV